MKKRSLLLCLLSLSLLVGCGDNTESGNNTPVALSDPNALVATPETDALDLLQKDQLEGKKFAGFEGTNYDHIGLVSLRSCTDGDTANFIQDDYIDEFGSYVSIKTRFLGVNTAESTAKVQPWGKKGSLFTKKILEEAQAKADEESTPGHKVYNICLVNSVETFGEKDSSGGRWLAFVWYRKSSTSKWRLLNLELVEQGYSTNQLFKDDDFCPYCPAFERCEAKNNITKLRVYGTPDPDYDYQEKSYEYSLWSVIHHYDDIGITEDGSSGVQLVVTALVVGIQGDNVFLRDVLLDDEQVTNNDMSYAGLYAYAGYNSSLCSILQNGSQMQGLDGKGIGIIIRFYCRATYYNGNIQLSDVKTSTTGKKKIEMITESNFSKFSNEYSWSNIAQNGDVTYDDLNKDATAQSINPEGVSKDVLDSYQYHFVSTTVTIRSVSQFDYDDDGKRVDTSEPYWYKGNANDNSYTVYAKIGNVVCNLRVDTSISPFIEHAFFGTANAYNVDGDGSPVGKEFYVTGYLAKYYDNYQLLLPNNYPSYNYIHIVE